MLIHDQTNDYLDVPMLLWGIVFTMSLSKEPAKKDSSELQSV